MRALAVSLLLLMPLVAPAKSALDTESIDAKVAELMDAHDIPGVSLAVIDDFEIVYLKTYGEAEPGRPVEQDTLFQAASLSKPIAGLVAGAADELGLFDLDARASDMLTSWQLRPRDEEATTIRALFAHRAGVNVSGFPGYSLNEPLPELDRILLGVRDKNEPIGVVLEPGPHEYSGGGFLIAQLAIEDATGQTWEDIADETVFVPLDLELTTYRLFGAEDRDRLAVGYRPDRTEVAGGGWHQYPETAPASLWTTAEEYAVILIDVMRSYVDGSGVILDQSTAQSILDPDYAVGFSVSREEGGIAAVHYGANEGYRCGFVTVPHPGEGVVVFTNSDNGLGPSEEIINHIGGQFGWPWTGWATPLWMVLVGLGLIAATIFVLYRLRRRLAFKS